MQSKIYPWILLGNTSLLDCGCAEGEQAAQWRGKVAVICAIDANSTYVLRGRQLYESVNFSAGQSEHLPYRDNSFDIVLLMQTLEHVEDERATLRQIHRVLKPQGRVIITVPHKGTFAFMDPLNLRHRVPGLFNRLLLRSSWRSNGNVPYHRHYSLEELKDLMGERFRILRVYRGGLFVRPMLSWVDGAIMRLARGKHPLQPWLYHIAGLDLNMDYGRASYDIGVIAEKA